MAICTMYYKYYVLYTINYNCVLCTITMHYTIFLECNVYYILYYNRHHHLTPHHSYYTMIYSIRHRNDMPFPSLEHALQGSKTTDPELHSQLNAISDTRELKRTALKIFKNINMDKWNVKSAVIAEQLLR